MWEKNITVILINELSSNLSGMIINQGSFEIWGKLKLVPCDDSCHVTQWCRIIFIRISFETLDTLMED